jgi:hypothetical protein
MLHETSFQIINVYSISDQSDQIQSYCDTSYARDGVNQMWILKNSKDVLESTYNIGPSPPAMALTHLNSLPSTQLLLTLSW